MSAWEKLTSRERESAWDRFESQFVFRPSMTTFPGIREPKDSVTYDISRVYGSGERYQRLTMDLSHKLIAALRSCVPEGGVVYVLDWHSTCFRFMPHASFAFESEDDWPVPVLPNGEYSIFLNPDLRFGIFGHPWEQTICIFGQTLLKSLQANLPKLFEHQTRAGGKVV